MRKSLKILNHLLFLFLIVSVAFRPVVVWADQSPTKSQIPTLSKACGVSQAHLQKQAPAHYLSCHFSILKIVPKEETKEAGLAPAASKIKFPLNDSLNRFAAVPSFRSFTPQNFLVLRI